MTTAAPEVALWFLNGLSIIKVAQADNADGISVIEALLPFNDAPPRHIHHGEDEIFYILDGRMRFEVDGAIREAGPGEMLLAPRGSRHGFRVISPEGARMLTITRGGFEAMVRAIGRPAEALVLPPFSVPTPAMQAALAEACAHHDIEVVGPPVD